MGRCDSAALKHIKRSFGRPRNDGSIKLRWVFGAMCYDGGEMEVARIVSNVELWC